MDIRTLFLQFWVQDITYHIKNVNNISQILEDHLEFETEMYFKVTTK